MKLYNTIAKEASAEQIIEKSRFISYVRPVSSKEEADAFVAEIKRRHRDATHNVPAMIIGDKMQIQWASDDGEPQGTSGAPIIKMMTGAGITNAVIVVTRYFGGIKLGTGGLARAYTSSAKLGLEAAGICSVESRLCLKCEFDYTYLAKLQNLAGDVFDVSEVKYTDKVEADITCEPEEGDAVKDMLKNLTSGRLIIKTENILEIKIKM